MLTGRLDAGDSPLALLRKEISPPTPIFSFCKTRNYSDILLPNIIEGDVFVRPKAKRAFRPNSRAGKLTGLAPMQIHLLRECMLCSSAYTGPRTSMPSTCHV